MLSIRNGLASIPAMLTAAVLATPSSADDLIDYGKQIRPLLSNHCYKCHGPDAENRQAGLRLDTKDGAFGQGNRILFRDETAEDAFEDVGG